MAAHDKNCVVDLGSLYGGPFFIITLGQAMEGYNEGITLPEKFTCRQGVRMLDVTPLSSTDSGFIFEAMHTVYLPV